MVVLVAQTNLLDLSPSSEMMAGTRYAKLLPVPVPASIIAWA